MDRIKRSKIIKVLGSGWSAMNISSTIGNIINQPQEDVLRILEASHWDRKQIMGYLDMFSTSKDGIEYVDSLNRTR